VGRAILVAVFLAAGVAAVARADEAAAGSALDGARAQLEKKQWDLCRDALTAAAKEIKGLDPRARAAAQKEHDALLAKCNRGEADYPFKAAVAQVKATLENARQELGFKNPTGAATYLDDARKTVAGIDPETQERFAPELAAVAKALEAAQLDARMEQIDRLLDQQEAELAKKPSALATLEVGSTFIDGELRRIPEADSRRAARTERFKAQAARIASIAQSERGDVLAPALDEWKKIREGAQGASSVKTPTAEAWRKAPHLSAHAGACERLVDAVETWLSSPRVIEAQHTFAKDQDLAAALAEAHKLEDDARTRLCEVASGIVALGEGPVPSIRELMASVEKRVAAPQRDGVLARARDLVTKLEARAAAGSDQTELALRLRAAACAAWPGMLAAHGETSPLGSGAIPGDGSWDGKLVRLAGLANQVGQPFLKRHGLHVVAVVNGGLVAGELDEGLWDAVFQARMQTGVEPEAITDVLAEVRGRCRVDPRTFELVRDPAVPAAEVPLLRIIAFDAGVYALSVKKGVSLPAVEGQAPIAVTERGIPTFERRLAGRPKPPAWAVWAPFALGGVALLAILGGVVSTVRLLRARKRESTMVYRRSRASSSASSGGSAVETVKLPVAGKSPVTVSRINGIDVRKAFCDPCGKDNVVDDWGRCILCGAEAAEPAAGMAGPKPKIFQSILSGATGPSYSGFSVFSGGGLAMRLALILVGICAAAAGVGVHGGRYHSYGRYGWRTSAPPPSYPQRGWSQPATPHGPGFDMPEYDAANGGFQGGDDEGD
jgi:hypothetical protein